MKSNKKNEILKYFVPPLITVTAIMIIFAVKGQYPFGSGTIMDNDWGPADFPGFVRFWDVAHGKESVFFDWSTGLGLPKSAVGYFLYPVNYLLLLFKRDYLYEAMNYYYIAQMATVSVTSFAFFRNAFKKLPLYYTYLFSLAFTFCGFNLQYYTNIGWLSAVAVFPLVALACYKLMKEKGFVFYTLILAYSLVINTYFTFFMLEGIVLIGTLYIFCFLEKKDRKGAAFRLGMGTASAFLISLWSVLSFSVSTMSSTRVRSGADSGVLIRFLEILRAENSFNSYRFLMLLGMEIGVFALVMVMIKYKAKKKSVFFLLCSFLLLLPVFFDSIDLLLNGGSYNYYVMRNGFILPLFLMGVAAHYFSDFDNVDSKEKNKVMAYIKPVICILAFYIVVPMYVALTINYSYRTALNDNGKMLGLSKLFSSSAVFIAVLFAMFLIVLMKNKKARAAFLCALLLFSVGVDSFRLIGAREVDENVAETESYLIDAVSIKNEVERKDPFSRISNPSLELYMNYPMLVNRSAVSDWSHIVSEDFRNTFYQLGYSLAFTAVSDAGSTAFGNSLLLVDNVVSTENLNLDLFKKIKDIDKDYKYYDCNYKLPLGVSFDKSVFDLDFGGNLFEYQNNIFSEVSNDDKQLFLPLEYKDSHYEKYEEKRSSVYDKDYKVDKDVYKSDFKCHIDEKSVVYFYLNDGSDILADDIVVNDCSIKINGNDYVISGYPSDFKNIYRTGSNNNILELGTFENEDVTIELNSTHPEIDKPVVYAMSLEKLDNLCKNYKSCVTEYSTGKKSMSIKATGEEGRYLFIPVYNNGSWVCTVNGEKTDVKSVLGSFMAIPLKDGENDIYIDYVPKMFYITLAFSALSLAAFIVIMILIKKKQFKAPEKLQGLFLWALTGLFAAFVTIAYIIPLIAQVYYAIVGRG